jgi:hypothetical protein
MAKAPDLDAIFACLKQMESTVFGLQQLVKLKHFSNNQAWLSQLKGLNRLALCFPDTGAKCWFCNQKK